MTAKLIQIAVQCRAHSREDILPKQCWTGLFLISSWSKRLIVAWQQKDLRVFVRTTTVCYKLSLCCAGHPYGGNLVSRLF